MINALYLYSAYLVIWPLKVLYTLTHQWWQTTIQGAGATIGNNLGFRILPEDTLTCGQEEPGIESLIFWLGLPPEPQQPQLLSQNYIYNKENAMAVLNMTKPKEESMDPSEGVLTPSVNIFFKSDGQFNTWIEISFL